MIGADPTAESTLAGNLVMVTGEFRSLSVMEDALEQQAADLIGMGRPFIIDPEFPNKMLNGQLQQAPAVERDQPIDAATPRGAQLNWFCYQLAL